MATTYNNLYLDARARLKKAGVEAAQLEAREIVCYAADKSREQLYRDMSLYASAQLEKRVEELVQRRLAGEPGGLYHRGVGVLWPAPGHQPGCAHPPGRHRAAGRTGHRRAPGGRGGGTGAGPVRRKRLRGTGHRLSGTHLPGGAGRSVRGGAAYLQAERAAQRPERPGHLSLCGRHGQPQPRPVGL